MPSAIRTRGSEDLSHGPSKPVGRPESQPGSCRREIRSMSETLILSSLLRPGRNLPGSWARGRRRTGAGGGMSLSTNPRIRASVGTCNGQQSPGWTTRQQHDLPIVNPPHPTASQPARLLHQPQEVFRSSIVEAPNPVGACYRSTRTMLPGEAWGRPAHRWFRSWHTGSDACCSTLPAESRRRVRATSWWQKAAGEAA